MSSITTKFKEAFELEEVISIFMLCSIAGSIIMWLFFVWYGTGEHIWGPTALFLTLAILFTILAPVFFIFLWFRKKKA